MVTDNFSKSGLDLNGIVSLSQPTALVWGADGRLYVTEVSGSVKIMTVAFGDKDPADGDPTSTFYVTEAETLDLVTSIPNFNDDGTPSAGSARQVTGIDVVPQYDADGFPVIIGGKPAVTIYVTSSDSRIGAGGDGSDSGLDTNSGIITRIEQTETGWMAVDIVRGLARSEENHALNGLEIIQELDETGRLVSERMIVANGGNTNTGAPSNNFAGQQETAYSAAILEVDLDQLNSMPVLTDPLTGRAYVYDIPTLDDPTRIGTFDDSDPFGGNDGLNAGKIDPDGPVQIYSAGYRNSYDVEVTEDGRVWTYDNGANNSWGGRPIGEAGDDGGTLDYSQLLGYIATNLNNGDVNTGDTINLEAWSPKNYDQFHEVTRSDDLEGRLLSAGQGDATTYEWTDPDTGELLTLVYGGHPNPTRASGGQSGILFTPKNGVEDAYLLLSSVDRDGAGTSDFAAVHDWLTQVESQYDTVTAGELTGRLIGVVPGEHYYITDAGNAYLVNDYPVDPTTINGETVLGDSGMPVDFDSVVASINPIEGDYHEGGFTDGALDSGKGSINGLTEYTSTLLDDPENGIQMSGAILAASLNQGSLIVMGRDADGVMQTTIGSSGQTLAEERTIISVSGAPLGLASIGDDLSAFDGETAFQGSIWTTVFKQNGPFIEILQPNNGTVPLAGSVVSDPTDQDLDGVDHLHDPFEFSDDNGFDLDVGEQIFLDFQPTESPYPGTILDTGLMGASLDGVTPNRDAKTAEEGFGIDQQEDGLYDLGGNIIPGGNAPIFQIKKVAGGTVVGTANSARDAMHVGIKPTPDVQRLLLTTKVKNWVPSVTDGPRAGQLTGFMLGDGTQSNFLRLVFGAVMIDGVITAGFEVGYEVDDAYTVLTRVAAPELAQSDVATVDLHLTVDIADGFSVDAGYRLNDDPQLTSLDLAGFRLPAGILQDILTGAHTISDGDTTLPSGAAVGFLAETSAADAASEQGLSAIDFYHLSIEARGNDIAAVTGAEVGTEGTEGIDTIVYTGTDNVLAPLADSVENFDGSGSGADFQVTGNSGDNVLIAGSGSNTFAGGGGSDSIRGTVDSLDGSVLTDFYPDDELILLGSYLDETHVAYALDGSGLLLTFTDPDSGRAASVRLTGEQFAGFDPVDGPAAFVIETTAAGTRVTYQPETILYRVNAGGSTQAALDGELDWQGDIDPSFAYLVGDASDVYGGSATDEQQEIDLSFLDAGVVPWALFSQERYDGSSADPKLEYAFPVTSGNTYEVTVYYTENWSGIFGYAGERRFDIEVEGLVPDEFSGLNPIQEASALLGPDATQGELLGVGLSRTYILEATDDTLNLAFLHGDQNPKVNAIEIKQLGVTLSSPDTQPPLVESISVEAPTDADSPLIVTVVVSDDRGVDLASIQGDELAFTGIVPASVGLAVGDAIGVSADGKTVTILYQALPPSDTNAWPDGDYGVAVQAGGYLDEAGNGAEAFASDFQIRLDDQGAALFVLDFETVGEPLDEGGFDDVLGGVSDATVLTTIAGGDLVVQTSNGDISRGASANDFIKFADLSGAELNEVRISSRLDNPFPEALAAQGLSTGTIPNYAQQGIIFGLGSQDKNEVVKLVFGGNKGNAIQIWSRPDAGTGIDTVYSLGDLFNAPGLGLEDVAELEMTLLIDKAAGTVTPIVTLFDAAGAVIGGLRSSATEGFMTAQAESLPTAVLDNLLDATAPTAIGVTSNDFGKMGAYEARWQYLEATSPDVTGPADPWLVAIADAPTVTESGDTGTTTLAFAVTTDASINEALTLSYQIDGGASQTQTVSITDGVGTLSVLVANDNFDDGPDTLTVVMTEVAEAGYAIDLAADTAAGTVAEDDTATLIAIADAPTVIESGDTGTTTLAFAVTTAATVTGTLTLSYQIDGGGSQTQTVSITDGVGTLNIEVANDDVDNGAENVSVLLAGVSEAGFAIDPAADTAAGTVTEDDTVALIAIADASTVTESGDTGTTTLAFAVTTDAAVTQSLTLSYQIDGGASQTQTVNVTNGVGTLNIEVTNDNVDDGPENVSVLLASVSETGYAIDPAADTASGTVTEDDTATLIAIADAPTVTESGDTGTTTLAFAVTTDAAVTQSLTLSYQVGGGASQTQTVSITDGVGTLNIEVTNDNVDDGPENVSVLLSSVSETGYAIDPAADTASGTVTEDDTATLIAIADAPTVIESGDTGTTTLAFAVTTDASVNEALTLSYQIDGGGSQTQTVSITDGVGTLNIEVANDDVDNGPDSIAVLLAGVSEVGYAIDPAADTASGTVTEDDTATLIAIADAPTVTESGDTGTTILAFAVTTDAAVTQSLTLSYQVGGGASQTQTVIVTDGVGTLNIEVANDDVDDGAENVSVLLAGVSEAGYAIDPAADTASGTVTEDDTAKLIAIADAPTVIESGDTGTTTLAFAVTTDAALTQSLTLSYQVDGGASQTQAVNVTNGVGTLNIEVANDDVDDGPENVSVLLAGVSEVGYAIDPAADTASGTVTEDDTAKLIAIADAPTVTESGDSGTTTLAFAVTTDASINEALTLSYQIDGGASQTQTVIITDGVGTLNIEVANDDVDDGPDSIAVLLAGVAETGYAIDPAADTASGTVEEDDAAIIDEGLIFTLDFETPGEPLLEGGFDGVLGGISDATVITAIDGGDLVVQTSDGDIYKATSANDFIKFADLSGSELNEVRISSRFDNPFPEALAAQGFSAGTIPNYAQQGVVFGVGTQDKNELVKLVLSGNKGNAIQIWSRPDAGVGIDTVYSLDELFSVAGLGLEDVAEIEMTLVIDKAAGTVTPEVTVFDASGAVIGGLSAAATEGFVTAQAEILPVAVLDNLRDATAPTAIGVTSNDFGTLGSYEARWQYLEVTTPDATSGPGDPWLVTIADAPTVTENGDTGTTLLAFEVSTDATVTDQLGIAYSLDGGATTRWQTVDILQGQGSLQIDVVNDDLDDGSDLVELLLIGTDSALYAIDSSANMAAGLVLEDEAASPATAEEVFSAAGLAASETYPEGTVGAATITVTPGQDVQHSNFGSDSFTVTNIGDKKIAAIFIDARPSLYGDSVFDADGTGGDTTFKGWQIDTSGGTGALQPSNYSHYFFAGADPDPTNVGNSGGFRGALVQFSATLDGGFTTGETVGFSGDMDPNSIAGMQKSGTSGVDTNSVPDWDVGGVSGAEMMGAVVHVLFSDGSTASAQLMGDGSQSGAKALITQEAANDAVELSVNGLLPGEFGSYNDVAPTVQVTGEPGAWVRVVMSKGHQPVSNDSDHIADIVDWHLSDEDFRANNAAEFQTVDIQLDASGQADVSSLFTYDAFLNGTESFAGDGQLPLGFMAAVIDDPTVSDGFAKGAVTSPIYLVHDAASATTSTSMETLVAPAEAPSDEGVMLVGLSPEGESGADII